MSLLNLNTPTNLPPVGKGIVFQNDGKSAQAAKCVKYRINNKVIYCVLLIDTFEKQCVVLKGILQSPRLKYNMNTIGIYQLLRNSDIFEHRCLQNINKLYKHSGKCDSQQKFKDIIEAAIVSTPEGFTNNTPRYPMTPQTSKKLSARKPLCIFTNVLDLSKKNAFC